MSQSPVLIVFHSGHPDFLLPLKALVRISMVVSYTCDDEVDGDSEGRASWSLFCLLVLFCSGVPGSRFEWSLHQHYQVNSGKVSPKKKQLVI